MAKVKQRKSVVKTPLEQEPVLTPSKKQQNKPFEKENTDQQPTVVLNKASKSRASTLVELHNGDEQRRPVKKRKETPVHVTEEPLSDKPKKRKKSLEPSADAEAETDLPKKAKKKKKAALEEERGGDEQAKADKKTKKSPDWRLTKKQRSAEKRQQDRLARNQRKREKARLREQRKNGEKPAKQPNPIPAKLRRQLMAAYEEEARFVADVFASLPKKQGEQLDRYLLDEATPEQELKKRQEYFKRTNTRSAEDAAQDTGPVPTREELKARLHAKIAEVAQGKRTKKKRKVLLDEDGAPVGPKNKKQFIAKRNPNFVKGAGTNGQSACVKAESAEKTPLRKKPVKTSNGQVVYSKFDFISAGKQTGKQGGAKPAALLKSAEKTESRISHLERSGKTKEAVLVAEKQKWDTALKRADGDKVRDDPALLKKTIKKQQKVKERSQKKWTERTDWAEKQQQLKTTKRLQNITARKEDKKKRTQKMQRKRGRIV